jgi:hypothetical protein
MFPAFFIGSMFLFMLVRSLLHGPRMAFYRPGYRYGSWASPWGRGGRWDWDSDDPEESLWGDRAWWQPRSRSRDAETSVSGAATRDHLDAAIRQFIASLRARLRATPAQEKAIAQAVTRVREAGAAIKQRTSEARDHLARAVVGDTFESTAFDAASHRVEQAMQELRAAARVAFAQVHDVLDRRQRAILASMIESTRSADIDGDEALF